MLPAMFNLVSTTTPMSISAELLSSWVPQHVLVPGIVPPQVQDFAILLAELHEIFAGPPLHPIEVPLDGGTALW